MKNINIGDTWKPVSARKINIGDSWKTVQSGQINVGDTWKSMHTGEYLGAGSGTTKLLLHLSGNCLDTSGNNVQCTGTSVLYGTAYGKFGQGVHLTIQSGSTILVPHTTDFNLDTGTISCWIGQATAGTYFLIKNSAGSATRWWARFAGAGNIEVIWSYNGESVYDYNKSVGGNINQSDWFNIIITHDMANRDIKIYINGVDRTGTMVRFGSWTGAVANTYPLQIGYSNTTFGVTLNFDEIIIENRIWTATDALNYYTYQFSPFL